MKVHPVKVIVGLIAIYFIWSVIWSASVPLREEPSNTLIHNETATIPAGETWTVTNSTEKDFYLYHFTWGSTGDVTVDVYDRKAEHREATVEDDDGNATVNLEDPGSYRVEVQNNEASAVRTQIFVFGLYQGN